ncbi:sulfotransferase domain-containing protein [Sphingomonas suaedae]|uniref:Sulfotransferase domain-containing protein n=1 Tax=Sphingomonas suaedae TaxID=2599297 RepID=A0A518RLN6_9SPHN|nr:sulfotransferase domain-containing protein [Sphingomonas suaedae]
MTARLFWLASYPKSGNTWFRAFIRNLNGEADAPASINDLSSTGIASSRAWMDEMLGFDTADLDRDEIARLRPAVYGFTSAQLRTFSYHKIHDACHRVDDDQWIVNADATAGALYLIRNPLDVAISYAHHDDCSIDESIAKMEDPDHHMAPHDSEKPKPQIEQRMLTWSDHVRSWVDNPDIRTHVLRYEDMKTDTHRVFSLAARFLNLSTDPEAIARALEFSTFERLRAQEDEEPFRERNPRSSRFFRKGLVGDWQTTLTRAQIDRIVAAHGAVMERFGYLDQTGSPRTM